MKNYIYIIVLLMIMLCSCESRKSENNPPEVKAHKMSEDVVFNTIDNKKIQGTYYYNNYDLSKRQPLVILIHQFMSDRSQWKSELIDSLIGRKFKVVTYDIRNHGESDKGADNIEDILTEKGNAILDLQAVFKWAKTRSGIDSMRIAVIGTSVGGSLALYSKYELGSKTAVAISAGLSTFDAFNGNMSARMSSNSPVPVKKISNVLFICGDKDGIYPEDTKKIYTDFTDDPKELKYFNSDKHGKDLCTQHPEIKFVILEWLGKNL
ncbi:MAG: alpha/beta fold hydrolase [Ignavibacteriae bacterium]|nr:alpha/beta fold hydrolase [Ignavibacteriota bacterium]